MFNDTVEAMTGIPGAPAGCTAIATVQLMAFFEQPYNSYEGLTINWSELCKYTGAMGNRNDGYKEWEGVMSSAPQNIQDMCADFIYKLGVNMNMTYSANGSGAWFSDAATSILQPLGYTVPSMSAYGDASVVGSVCTNRPVVIQGYRDDDDNPSKKVGHTWLIDGYIKQQSDEIIYLKDPSLPLPNPDSLNPVMIVIPHYRDFLHNNWGWNGSDNGYFAKGLFNTANPGLPSNTTRAKDYRYNLTVWTGIQF